MKSSPRFKVRLAKAQDAPALGRMGAALAHLHHHFDSKRFMLPADLETGYRQWLTRELRQPKSVVLVAELDDAIVGYAYGRLEERDWNALLDAHGAFHDLWVDEPARREGIGVALGKEMNARLCRLGAPRVVLSSAAKNAPAQELFARLGWRPTMIEMTREATASGEPCE